MGNKVLLTILLAVVALTTFSQHTRIGNGGTYKKPQSFNLNIFEVEDDHKTMSVATAFRLCKSILDKIAGQSSLNNPMNYPLGASLKGC